MIAFSEMLVNPASEAGIAVPPDLKNFDPNEFPHWVVFVRCQIGQPLPHWSAHWENAKVIAGIPTECIKSIRLQEILNLGFQVGYPLP